MAQKRGERASRDADRSSGVWQKSLRGAGLALGGPGERLESGSTLGGALAPWGEKRAHLAGVGVTGRAGCCSCGLGLGAGGNGWLAGWGGEPNPGGVGVGVTSAALWRGAWRWGKGKGRALGVGVYCTGWRLGLGWAGGRGWARRRCCWLLLVAGGPGGGSDRECHALCAGLVCLQLRLFPGRSHSCSQATQQPSRAYVS